MLRPPPRRSNNVLALLSIVVMMAVADAERALDGAEPTPALLGATGLRDGLRDRHKSSVASVSAAAEDLIVRSASVPSQSLRRSTTSTDSWIEVMTVRVPASWGILQRNLEFEAAVKSASPTVLNVTIMHVLFFDISAHDVDLQLEYADEAAAYTAIETENSLSVINLSEKMNAAGFSGSVEVQVLPSSVIPPDGIFLMKMTVRIPLPSGDVAWFDSQKVQMLRAAVRRISTPAVGVRIESTAAASMGRRRLLSTYLDISLAIWYPDEDSAVLSAQAELTVENLNYETMQVKLTDGNTLTIVVEPKVFNAASGELIFDLEAEMNMNTILFILVPTLFFACAVACAAGLLHLFGKKGRAVHDGDVKVEEPLLNDDDMRLLFDAVLTAKPIESVSKFGVDAKELITGQAKSAADGLEALLCIQDRKEFYDRISDDVKGIEEEVREFDEKYRGGTDEDAKKVLELFNYIVYEGTSEKTYENGIRDKGREPGTTLSYFVSHRKAKEAGLKECHVVALRMYTTAIYKYMNNPLRDQKRRKKEQPCLLPVTTWFAAEGIKKLRSLHAPKDAEEDEPWNSNGVSRTPSAEMTNKDNDGVALYETGTARKYLTTPPGDEPEPKESRASLPAAAQFQTLAIARAPSVELDQEKGATLWRGMRNMKVSKPFESSGGTELAFMSTTRDLSVAAQYSLSPNSLLFKIKVDDFMSMGADLQFLSAFPSEAEFLYPPITYLKPTGRVSSNIEFKKQGQVFKFTVVEVEPIMG